jgi:hypothetical protein
MIGPSVEVYATIQFQNEVGWRRLGAGGLDGRG